MAATYSLRFVDLGHACFPGVCGSFSTTVKRPTWRRNKPNLMRAASCVTLYDYRIHPRRYRRTHVPSCWRCTGYSRHSTSRTSAPQTGTGSGAGTPVGLLWRVVRHGWKLVEPSYIGCVGCVGGARVSRPLTPCRERPCFATLNLAVF